MKVEVITPEEYMGISADWTLEKLKGTGEQVFQQLATCESRVMMLWRPIYLAHSIDFYSNTFGHFRNQIQQLDLPPRPLYLSNGRLGKNCPKLLGAFVDFWSQATSLEISTVAVALSTSWVPARICTWWTPVSPWRRCSATSRSLETCPRVEQTTAAWQLILSPCHPCKLWHVHTCDYMSMLETSLISLTLWLIARHGVREVWTRPWERCWDHRSQEVRPKM